MPENMVPIVSGSRWSSPKRACYWSSRSGRRGLGVARTHQRPDDASSRAKAATEPRRLRNEVISLTGTAWRECWRARRHAQSVGLQDNL